MQPGGQVPRFVYDEDGDDEDLEDIEPWVTVERTFVPGPPPPWVNRVALQRLMNITEFEAPPGPPRAVGVGIPENMLETQELLIDYCRETIPDPQALEERTQVIMNVQTLHNSNPPWLTLKPPEDGRCWKRVVSEICELEDYAFENLQHVATFEGFGQYEVNRILAHLLKDSTSQQQRERHCASKWVQRACQESLQAMAEWSVWDADRQRNQGLEYVHQGGNGTSTGCGSRPRGPRTRGPGPHRAGGAEPPWASAGPRGPRMGIEWLSPLRRVHKLR